MDEAGNLDARQAGGRKALREVGAHGRRLGLRLVLQAVPRADVGEGHGGPHRAQCRRRALRGCLDAATITVMPEIDADLFRRVMGAYPTGVTIITAAGDGTYCGMAANSFTSVSLDPPIVLVCTQNGARTSAAAKASGRFAIHFMSHDQVPDVRSFVGLDAPRFAAVAHDPDEHGTPILREWLALLVCRLHDVSEVGDHEVLFGLVERCEKRERAPLLFHESALRMLPRLPAIRPSGRVPEIDDEDDLNDPLVRVLAPVLRPESNDGSAA